MPTAVGDRYGALVVLELIGNSRNGTRVWLCQCDCGELTSKFTTQLNAGKALRCRGCFSISVAKQHVTHGMTGSPEWLSWRAMHSRCSNPNNPDYKHYGGRGIIVCERWKSFKNFYQDMGQRPERMTLDRKDVNGNYEPSNCKWSTHQEQALNKRKKEKVEGSICLPL